MTTALFSIAGAVALLAAVVVVTSRRIVHAALWLVVALGAVAGCFGALHAEFVALVQILVYVGAIVVLVLFALMLTKAPTNPLPALTTRRSPFAAVVALRLRAGPRRRRSACLRQRKDQAGTGRLGRSRR